MLCLAVPVQDQLPSDDVVLLDQVGVLGAVSTAAVGWSCHYDRLLPVGGWGKRTCAEQHAARVEMAVCNF